MTNIDLIYLGFWFGLGIKTAWTLWDCSVKFMAYIIDAIIKYNIK